MYRYVSGCTLRVHNISTTVMTRIVVDKSTHHIRFVNSIRQVFLRACVEKGIAGDIEASSVVWSLIDNGESGDQIARLAAIVVKFKF